MISPDWLLCYDSSWNSPGLPTACQRISTVSSSRILVFGYLTSVKYPSFSTSLRYPKVSSFQPKTDMQKSCQKETQQPPKWDPQGIIFPHFGCLFWEFNFYLFLDHLFSSLGPVKTAKTAILSSFSAYRPFRKKSSKWVPKSSNLGPLLDDFASLEVTKKLHQKVIQTCSKIGPIWVSFLAFFVPLFH